jgi:acyl dehydratase
MDMTVDQLRTCEKVDLGASSWFHIDQARIAAFAEATEDRQWIHLDPEKAKETRFGGTIAHGFLLISLVTRLFDEMFHVPDAEMLINYGLDKVRFIHPVPSGSDIRLEARISSVTPKGDNLMLRIRGQLVLREGETTRKTVLIETLFLVVPPAKT